ncbi:MAG TPA: cytochrome d ubiquinol oxidase subunit II [Egicoccus sp.]|nr:cytochrome d ubiquinol oxidase subunit II [Egicoccus sp.]HSK23626.1 cytochrome d ubiquinol oxidase subunit II [Egicoccus sp.]
MDWWNLETLWFALIAVLWIGYFVLEGFDFGVGMLSRVLAHDDVDRRVMINTIGPVWDGNEVWLLTAGGATFAAFPAWYATLFSSFYLPLLLILLALIVRGVAFEFRGKRDEARWRWWWDQAIFWGSLVPAVLWGVAFANIVRGIAIDGTGNYVGGFFDLLSPYALLGGIVSVTAFLLHGAAYLALKTEGELAERAQRAAGWFAGTVAIGTIGFLLWTYANALGAGDTGVVPGIIPIAAMGAGLAAWVFVIERKPGWAFVATSSLIALVTLTLFLNLYPRVLVSSLDPAFSLTIANSKASDLTLTLMSWATLLFLPLVLAYQAWTYWVFRHRVSRDAVSAPTDTPLQVLERRLARRDRNQGGEEPKLPVGGPG